MAQYFYPDPDALIKGANALFSGSTTTINGALALFATNNLFVQEVQVYHNRFTFSLTQASTPGNQYFYGSTQALLTGVNDLFGGSPTTVNAALAILVSHSLFLQQYQEYERGEGGNFSYFISSQGNVAIAGGGASGDVDGGTF